MSNKIKTSIDRKRRTRHLHYFLTQIVNSISVFLKVHTFLVPILLVTLQSASVLAEAPNEGYFGYLFEDGGDYPGTWTETRYSNHFNAITHDEDNWYLGQSGCKDVFGTPGLVCVRKLWKIPIEIDLNTNNLSVWWEWVGGSQWLPITPPGVQEIYLPDIRNQQYKLITVTDMEFHRKDGQGYLFVYGSFEEIATGTQYIEGIAVINPDTLTLIDLHIGWTGCIAASPDDRLLRVSGSSEHGTAVAEYVAVDWNALATQGQLVLNFPDPQDPDNVIPIWDPDGSSSSTGPNDCDLSPSGGLLYKLHGGSCALYNRVEVVDLTIGKIVQVSTNSKTGDYGHFDARYDPYICNSAEGESLDGLTIWDLEADTRAPGIRGRLHVVAVDYENWELSNTDDIRMMHYLEEIHVVQGSTATPERGTQNHPYNTLAEGIAGAWDYSKLYIWGSSYPETVIFDKKMDVVPLVFTPPYTLTIGE